MHCSLRGFQGSYIFALSSPLLIPNKAITNLCSAIVVNTRSSALRPWNYSRHFWTPNGCPCCLDYTYTHLLPQTIPSAHINPPRNGQPHDPFQIPSRLVVYSSPYFSQDQSVTVELLRHSTYYFTWHPPRLTFWLPSIRFRSWGLLSQVFGGMLILPLDKLEPKPSYGEH